MAEPNPPKEGCPCNLCRSLGEPETLPEPRSAQPAAGAKVELGEFELLCHHCHTAQRLPGHRYCPDCEKQGVIGHG